MSIIRNPWSFLAVTSLLSLIAIPGGSALGAVSLAFTDSDADPTFERVPAGGLFTVTLNLTATSEQTTAVNYYVESNAGGSGFFTLEDRNTVGSAYPEVYFSDATVEEDNVGPPNASALLDPRNDSDLGGSVADVNSPLNAGTHFVATYSFRVSPSTPEGIYQISTASNPGTGWAGGAFPFPDSAFNQHATFTVSVPEPASLGALAASAVMLFRRRRGC